MHRPLENADALFGTMQRIVENAPFDAKLKLIRAHPDLAGRIVPQGPLTMESTAEQAAAGLTEIDATTRKRIDELNAAYRGRFGFPFVICARLHDVNTTRWSGVSKTATAMKSQWR
jgi:2-oxo-4-hydroxy-4-carboxy-5-ureidoimidazoline decarboxylase